MYLWRKKKKKHWGKNISVWTQRLRFCICGSVLSAAKTNWQGWMHILAVLCSSPQNEEPPPAPWQVLKSKVETVGLDKHPCVILNCSSPWFHKLDSPVLYRSSFNSFEVGEAAQLQNSLSLCNVFIDFYIRCSGLPLEDVRWWNGFRQKSNVVVYFLELTYLWSNVPQTVSSSVYASLTMRLPQF